MPIEEVRERAVDGGELVERVRGVVCEVAGELHRECALRQVSPIGQPLRADDDIGDGAQHLRSSHLIGEAGETVREVHRGVRGKL